jgi:hypothetical protein
MKCNHPNARYFSVCPLILLDEVDEAHKFPDDCKTCEWLVHPDKREREPFVILTEKPDIWWRDDESNQRCPIIFNTEREATIYIQLKHKLGDVDAAQILETGYALLEPLQKHIGSSEVEWVLSDMAAQPIKGYIEYEISAIFDDRRDKPPEALEINFKDFSLEVQGLLLEMCGVDTPNSMNWNVFPVTVLEAPKQDGVEENKEEKTEGKVS